jgi:hypothetical protein
MQNVDKSFDHKYVLLLIGRANIKTRSAGSEFDSPANEQPKIRTMKI